VTADQYLDGVTMRSFVDACVITVVQVGEL
jgi:hypothetical protein